MKALDLFCGEGGISAGLTAAGWTVYGVDNARARLKNYPYPHENTDALTFLANGGATGYDYVHASPPCTGYTRGTIGIPDRLNKYERLIAVVRELLEATGLPYTIENVEGARSELRTPFLTCWTEFRTPGDVLDINGVPLWMRRHRLWESNVPLMAAGGCAHPANMQCAGAYSGARRKRWEAKLDRKGGFVPTLPVMRKLLGTPWMSQRGCELAIPPVYAEFVGTQVAEWITHD